MPDPTPLDRYDGMLNVLSGLGDSAFDKSRGSRFVRAFPLSPDELDALYEQRGLAARVVDMPAEELTREGFGLEGVEFDLDAFRSAWEDLGDGKQTTGGDRIVADLHRWGDHYGGALAVLAADDGQTPEMPLDLNRVRKLEGVAIIDRHCCEPILLDPRMPPEAYLIHGSVDAGIEGSVVHASRVIKHVGVPVSPRRQVDVRWWGASTMDRVWSELRSLFSAYGYAENILHDVSVDVFSVVGLFDLLAAGKDEAVRNRIRTIQKSKSIMRAVLLDAGGNTQGDERKAETYTPQSRNVSGIAELVELFIQAVVIAAGVPRSILLGETPGGLNTGSNGGETRAWYAKLAAMQRQRLTPWVNRILEVLFASREGPTRGVLPPSWTVKWKPLWSPTELEQAQARDLRAKGDALYVDMGAALPEQVHETRFVQRSTGELVDDFPMEVDALAEAEERRMEKAAALQEQMGGPGEDNGSDELDEDEGDEDDEA